MTFASPCSLSPRRSTIRSSALRSSAVTALVLILGGSAIAQDYGATQRLNRGDRGVAATAQDAQTRMLSQLRDRLGVANDDEWAIISDRVMKVAEARRATGGGFGSMMVMRGNVADSARANRRGGGNPEVTLLQSALTDNLPDAEIKARLERLRDVRKANEANLTKAQEDLREVLTVRQEALLVLAGLLP